MQSLDIDKILAGSQRPQDSRTFDRPQFLIWLWNEYCAASDLQKKEKILYEMCAHHQFVTSCDSEIHDKLIDEVRKFGRVHESPTMWAIVNAANTIELRRARSAFDEGMEGFLNGVDVWQNPYSKDGDDAECSKWFQWDGGWKTEKKSKDRDDYWRRG